MAQNGFIQASFLSLYFRQSPPVMRIQPAVMLFVSCGVQYRSTEEKDVLNVQISIRPTQRRKKSAIFGMRPNFWSMHKRLGWRRYQIQAKMLRALTMIMQPALSSSAKLGADFRLSKAPPVSHVRTSSPLIQLPTSSVHFGRNW